MRRYLAAYFFVTCSSLGYACEQPSLHKILSDTGKTELQRITAAERLCKSKRIPLTGAISDVFSWGFRLTYTDKGYAAYYNVELSQSHGCRELQSINKGDVVRVIATVTRINNSISVFADQGTCAK